MKIKKTYLIILLLILGGGVAYFYFFYTPKLQSPINVDFTIDGVMIEDKDNFIKKPKITETNKVYVQVPYKTIEFKPTFSLKENDENKILWKIKSTYLDITYSGKDILNTFFEKTGDYTITLIFNNDSISKLLYIVSEKKYAKLDNRKNVTSNSEKQVVLKEPNIKNPGVLVKTVDVGQTSLDEISTGTKKTSERGSISKTSTNERGSIEVFPEPDIPNTPDTPESLKPVDKDPKELYKIQMAKKDIKELHNNLKSIEQKLKNININSYDIMYIKKYESLNNRISLLNDEISKIFDYHSDMFKIEYDKIKYEIDIIQNKYSNLNSEFSDFIKEISRINLKEENDNDNQNIEEGEVYDEDSKNSPVKVNQIGLSYFKRCGTKRYVEKATMTITAKQDVELLSLYVSANDNGNITFTIKGNGEEETIDGWLNPGKSQIILGGDYPIILSKGITYTIIATVKGSNKGDSILENAIDCAKKTYSDDNIKISFDKTLCFFNIKYQIL